VLGYDQIGDGHAARDLLSRASQNARSVKRRAILLYYYMQSGGSVFIAIAHLADMMLRIKLDAELGHKVELSFQEVDMVLLV